jgi:hypothetical protein
MTLGNVRERDVSSRCPPLGVPRRTLDAMATVSAGEARPRSEGAQSAVPAIGASEGPSIKKKDQPAPSNNEQGGFDRFNDAVAFKVAFDRPDDADGDDEDPPVPPHQVEQPELWVHLRARQRAPPVRGSQGYRG